MFRLPRNRKARIQLVLVAVFLLVFYLGVRVAANWIGGGYDFLELQDAIARGDIGEIEHRLRWGVSPNVRNPSNGETLLHVAVRYGNSDVIRVLLAEGSDPNLRDDLGDTAFCDAAGIGKLDVVRVFAEAGVPLHDWCGVGSKKGTPALFALWSDHPDIANYILLDAGKGDLSGEDLNLLLMLAANAGQPDLARLAVEAGARPTAPSSDGLMPLEMAIMGGSVEVVQMLVDNGASITRPFITPNAPLLFLGAFKNGDMLDFLIGHGFDVRGPDAGGETALHYAAQNGRIDAARRLIERGAEVNAQDNFGEAPLHYAVEAGHIEMIQFLVERGADCLIANLDGKSPLDLARRNAAMVDRPPDWPGWRFDTEELLAVLEELSRSRKSIPIASP